MAKLRKKSGHYYARFYDRNRSPKRKELSLQATRKDVARRRLHDLEQRWQNGEFDPWNPSHSVERLTVKEGVERFMEAKQHLRASTRKNYRTRFNAWLRDHTPAGLPLASLDASHVRSYVHDDDVAQATKRSRFTEVRSLLNWWEAEGLIQHQPLDNVRAPTQEKKQAAFLSTDDVKKMLRAIDAHAELLLDQPGPNSDDEWLKQMIQVGVSTGLRRSALCRLRWADVDLNHQLLTVRNRGEEKTKSGDERSVPLRGDAFDVLARMKEQAQGDGLDHLNARVFSDSKGRAIRPDRASHRFKFFARKAKLKDRERLSFHSLRHTTGSWLAMQGVPMRVIQGILGHSTVNMTQRYSHLAPEVMEQAMEETFG